LSNVYLKKMGRQGIGNILSNLIHEENWNKFWKNWGVGGDAAPCPPVPTALVDSAHNETPIRVYAH